MAVGTALVVKAGPAGDLLREAFGRRGLDVIEAASSPDALEVLRTRPVTALVAPLPSGGPDPLDLVRRAVRLRTGLAVVLVKDGREAPPPDGVPSAVFDLVDAALGADRAAWIVDRVLAHQRLVLELSRLKETLRGRAGFEQLVGRSAAMERARDRVERLSRNDIGVLFVGEAGTGKKHAARVLHAWSPREDGPCLVVPCDGADTAELEVQIFGSERGVLRGRERRVVGALESAPGGTVVLDGLVSIPLEIQVRLAEALRSGELRRVGGVEKVPILARVVATTRWPDPERAVAEGRLLEDLGGRFAEVVHLPPLRERPEDIVPLASWFVEAVRRINDLPDLVLAVETADLLTRHRWPGNVRELRDALEHAVFLAKGGIVRPRDLPESVRGAAAAPPRAGGADRAFREAKREVVDSFERAYLADLMERHGGNVTAGAQHAGMLRSALQRLLRKHDLRSSDFRPGRNATTAPTDEP